MSLVRPDQIFAAYLLDRKQCEEEAAGDPKHNLDPNKQRQPLVNESCNVRELHGKLPLALVQGGGQIVNLVKNSARWVSSVAMGK